MFQPEGCVTLGSSDEARRFSYDLRAGVKMSSPTDGDRYAPVVAHRGSLLEAR
jgi:hypothetical protein